LLEKLRDGLQAAVKRVLGASTIDEEAIKEFVKDLQRTLLQSDVNARLVIDVSTRIERRALEENPPAGLPRRDHIVTILYQELARIMGQEQKFDIPKGTTSVILMMGIQGSGKTTVVGKLSRHLLKRGYSLGVVGADTFRPGALVQLRTLCSTSGIEVYGDEKEKNSISVATKGVEYFRDLNKDVVIVDTAGRHKEERSLLDEMKTISKKVSPAYSLLVIDGTIGQQSFKQAEAFHQANPVGGLIISKLDGAAKGGGALAAAAATGASILYIGTGERIDDLEPFSPTRFAGRLLGMGDLKALLERAKDLETEADEEKIKRMMSGKMTIDDLYYQLEQIKKMGSIRKILELVPGFSTALGDKDLKNVEEDMDKWKFIIQSMSKHERQNPDVLNSSRMRRIAKGSGRNEREIKDLLQRYKQAKVVFKASKGRGMKQFMKKLAPQ